MVLDALWKLARYYRSADPREIEFVIEMLNSKNLQRYLGSIAMKLAMEYLEWVVQHAKEFNESLEFLLSLPKGQYRIDKMDFENIYYRVLKAYDKISQWLIHLSHLLKILKGSSEIETIYGWKLPDGLEIRINTKPVLSIQFWKNGKLVKDIYVNDLYEWKPWCPAMTICVR